MHIFLVGFMGCGKSEVGKTLSVLLGCRFIDLDTYIEKRYGKSIPDIFLREGEISFRRKEHACLKKITARFNLCFIATGGGTPCFHANMELMKKTGITIYLQMTPAALHKRLMRHKSRRPLIRALRSDKLLKFIRYYLKRRKRFYEQAQIIVNGEHSAEKVARKISELLRRSQNKLEKHFKQP